MIADAKNKHGKNDPELKEKLRQLEAEAKGIDKEIA